jgi:predicted dehydrogenase
LDYIRWLAGDVDLLWSFNGHISLLDLDVEDVAEIGLQFTSGAIGGIHVNYVQRPPVHRVEISGTGGTLRWDNTDGLLYLYRIPTAFGTRSTNSAAPAVEQFTPPDGFNRNTMFMNQMQHFIELVRGDVEPVCSLEDGVYALQMEMAAYESAKQGRTISLKGIL